MSPTKSSAPPIPADLENLRAVLDSAATPMFALDCDQRLLFTNRALAELLGVSPESLAGRNLTDLVDLMGGALESSAAFKQRVVSLLLDREGTTSELIEYRTDRRLYFKEISQPFRRPDGSTGGRLFIYCDVTREKKIDQAKSEFLSIAAHELRTPMTSIKGSLDLLLGGFAGEINEEVRELLLIGQNGCERLIRLINDILDLSKIEAGRMQLCLQTMSLFDAAQRSVRTIRNYADSFRVKLVIDCPSRMSSIIGDRDRIDQVITNLLGNAVRFSPPESKVTVALRQIGDMVECRVIDQGPGIPPDQSERIFGRFQQVEERGRGKKRGTGLGLAIARALVQEHGGKIWVESQPGAGSRFIFRIPLAPPAE